MSPWLLAFDCERVLFRLVLAAICVRALGLALSRRRPESPPALPADRAAWPTVTVQIPVRDERFVVEGALRAAAALDWPRDRLQIQVLDDSDDDTRDVVDRVCAELGAAGAPIEVLRRGSTEGFKAGALAYGIARSKSEFVALFDADFRPDPTFLRATVPHLLADPRAGLVQARWSHANERANLLTRAQAVVLDALMAVEQPARSLAGRVFHFNGTAGVWRRACIDAAGGWSGASVTEDLDLSCRALVSGWRLIHVSEVAVPNELPESMAAFRRQQRRWTRGNAQVLRAQLWPVLRSDAPVLRKLDLLTHLCSRAVALFVLFAVVSYPLTTFQVVQPLVDYSLAHDALVLGAVFGCLGLLYARAHSALGRPAWRGLLMTPVVVALYVGLCLSVSTAFLAGLTGRAAPFERTPKRGEAGGAARPGAYRPRLDLGILVETAIGAAYAALAALAGLRGLYAHALFCLFVGSAFLWVGGGAALEALGAGGSKAPAD